MVFPPKTISLYIRFLLNFDVKGIKYTIIKHTCVYTNLSNAEHKSMMFKMLISLNLAGTKKNSYSHEELVN